ncbi:MAG: signal peptidase II [Acidimicrobiia bacterium]|nr:signal peptidase II [Acidimicrobiia bacterium]
MERASVPSSPCVALVVVGALVWTGRSLSSRSGAVALGLVLGGALGNLADRAFRGDGLLSGRVVDFIDLQWWPVFNVADMGVVVGAILLLVVSYRTDRA